MLLETQPCCPGVMPSELGHWLPPAFPSVLSYPILLWFSSEDPARRQATSRSPEPLGKMEKWGSIKQSCQRTQPPFSGVGGEASPRSSPKTAVSLPFLIPVEQLGISVSKIRTTSWTHGEDSPVAQVCVRAKSLQLCLTLCDPIDCSPSGSSVSGILQAKILQWVAIPSSRGSSQPRDRTHISSVSCHGRWVLYH